MTARKEVGRVFADVSSINIHEDWNALSDDFTGDIAIIKLAESVNFNNFIRPICLPTTKIMDIKIGSVAGWGFYDDTRKTSNFPRLLTDIPIVRFIDCFKMEISLVRPAWSNSFCAGLKGAGVCADDSGSGFYVEKNGVYYLRGIVSSSVIRDCTADNLAIYADLNEYRNFWSRVSIMLM